jgi:hypothetical protein
MAGYGGTLPLPLPKRVMQVEQYNETSYHSFSRDYRKRINV